MKAKSLIHAYPDICELNDINNISITSNASDIIDSFYSLINWITIFSIISHYIYERKCSNGEYANNYFEQRC